VRTAREEMLKIALCTVLLRSAEAFLSDAGAEEITDTQFVTNALNTYVGGVLNSADNREKPNGTADDLTQTNKVLSPDIFINIYEPNSDRIIHFDGHCGIRHMYSQAFRLLGEELFFFIGPESSGPGIIAENLGFNILAKQKVLNAGFGSGDNIWHTEYSHVFFNDDGTQIVGVNAYINVTDCFYPDADYLFLANEEYPYCEPTGYYIQNPHDFPTKPPPGC